MLKLKTIAEFASWKAEKELGVECKTLAEACAVVAFVAFLAVVL